MSLTELLPGKTTHEERGRLLFLRPLNFDRLRAADPGYAITVRGAARRRLSLDFVGGELHGRQPSCRRWRPLSSATQYSKEGFIRATVLQGQRTGDPRLCGTGQRLLAAQTSPVMRPYSGSADLAACFRADETGDKVMGMHLQAEVPAPMGPPPPSGPGLHRSVGYMAIMAEQRGGTGHRSRYADAGL